MNFQKILLALILIVIAGGGLYFFKDKYTKSIKLTKARGELGNFSLLDHTGKFHELRRYADSTAIVFISQGNDCPIIQKYSQVINDLKIKFSPKNVTFFLINPNQQDGRDDIIREVKAYGLNIPVLIDPSQLVTEMLGITRTSEAVVVDPKEWKIIYRGSISDRMEYGLDKLKSSKNYLNDFLESFLQKKSYNGTIVPAKGCLITFSKPELSYSKNIVPVLTQKCLPCHSDNGKFPPYFSNHTKIKNWSEMIKETILTDRMPPGSVDTYYGSYKHNLALTASEKRNFIKWLEAGAPKEESADPLVGYAVRRQEKKENLEKIFEAGMDKDKIIPPEGENEYQYVQISGPLPHDLWIKALHVTSTNPRILHHMSVIATSQPLGFYIDYQRKNHPVDESARKNNKDGNLPLITKSSIYEYEQNLAVREIPRFQAWAAGKSQPVLLPPGVISLFPKGYYLILESHYMGTGKVEKERTSIKFYGFLEKPEKLKQFHTKTIVNQSFSIPPMVKDFAVETPTWRPKKNIHIFSFIAHLHMRGSSARIETTDNNGQKKTFMSIPNFYYGWQTGTPVVPSEPISIKRNSTTFQGICHYDNSPQNPNNPDPNKTIYYGQRHDTAEMCHFHINYTVDSE